MQHTAFNPVGSNSGTATAYCRQARHPPTNTDWLIAAATGKFNARLGVTPLRPCGTTIGMENWNAPDAETPYEVCVAPGVSFARAFPKTKTAQISAMAILMHAKLRVRSKMKVMFIFSPKLNSAFIRLAGDINEKTP